MSSQHRLKEYTISAVRFPRRRALTVLRLDQSPRESLRRKGLMSVVGLVSQSGARFAVNLAAGRLGGPTLLGQVAVAMSTAQLMALVGPTSLGSAASQYMALSLGKEDLDGCRTLARHIWRLALASAAILGLMGAVAWRIWFDGELMEAAALGLLVATLSTYTVARGMFFGHRHIGPSGAWDVVTAAIGVLGSTMMLWFGVRGPVALLPFAVGWGLYTWAGWPRGAVGAADRTIRHEVHQYVIVTALGSLASAGFVQASLVVARVVGGEEGSGYYSAAFTIAAPLSLLVGAANSVLLPTMAETLGQGSRDAFESLVGLSTEVVVAIMSGVLGSLIVVSAPVLRLLWGDRFQAGEPLLPVMLLAILVYVVGVPSVSAIVSRGATHARSTTGFSALGSLVGGLVWLITATDACGTNVGILGVALGYCAATVVTATGIIALVWRRERQRWTGLMVRLVIVGTAAYAAWAIPRSVSTVPLWAALIAFLTVWIAAFGWNIKRAVRVVTTLRR